MSNNDDDGEVLRAQLEKYAAAMTADGFRAFIMRVRPPGEALELINSSDPAVRMRAISASIATKNRLRPQVDHNGHPIAHQQIQTDPNYLNRLKGYTR